MDSFITILKKSIKVTALSLVFASLTGCSISIPFKSEQVMRVDPDLVTVDFSDVIVSSDASNSDGSGGGTDSGSESTMGQEDPSTAPGRDNNYVYRNKMLVNPVNFVPLEETQVSCTSYSKYLDEQVYNPIKKLIDELSEGDRKGIYFRVMHTGYDPQDDAPTITKALGYDNKVSYGISSVSSVSLNSYVVEWIGNIPYNASIIDSTRRSTQRRLLDAIQVNSNPVTGVSWSNTDWTAASNIPNFPTTILAMWGNERMNYRNLQSYIDALEDQIVGVIPNVNLKLFTSSSNQRTYHMNEVSNNMKHYVDSANLTDVNLVFTRFNQYADRSRESKEKTYTDSSSTLYTFTNGYSRTLVFIATTRDTDLSDVLQDKATPINEILLNIIPPTEWQAVEDIMPGISTIAAGSKGVD